MISEEFSDNFFSDQGFTAYGFICYANALKSVNNLSPLTPALRELYMPEGQK